MGKAGEHDRASKSAGEDIPADADPEGVQHPGIPGNPGHLGAVRGAHGGDAV